MEKFKYERYDYTKIEICRPKRLESTWTVTLSDINSYLNTAVDSQLTATVSTQIAEEIDRGILASLRISFNTTGPTYTPTYISNREDFINIYNHE